MQHRVDCGLVFDGLRLIFWARSYLLFAKFVAEKSHSSVVVLNLQDNFVPCDKAFENNK